MNRGGCRKHADPVGLIAYSSKRLVDRLLVIGAHCDRQSRPQRGPHAVRSQKDDGAHANHACDRRRDQRKARDEFRDDQ
jgi:hypothetical protein